MATFRAPDVQQHTDVAEYFKDFYQINKDNALFSHRKFSAVIGWPHSYLNDLIARRKGLSIARAVEFSKLLKLNSAETERLILMSLKTSDSPMINQYFSEQFETAMDLTRKFCKDTIGNDRFREKVEVIEGGVPDAATLIIFALVSWLRPQKVSIDRLRIICESFPQLVRQEDIVVTIDRLAKMGIVSFDGQMISHLRDAFFLAPGRLLKSSVDIMSELIGRSPDPSATPDGPKGIYRNGIVEFPIERMEELQQRIGNLANWIGNISRQALSQPGFDPARNPLIKYDVFAGRLFRANTEANLLRPESPAHTMVAEL